jgi:hypothetical protein
MMTVRPAPAKGTDGRKACRLDRVGDRNQSGELTIHRQIHGRLAVPTQRLGPFVAGCRRYTDGIHHRSIAECNGTTFHRRHDALAGYRFEVGGGPTCGLTLFGTGDDGLCQRMFGTPFQRGGQGQHVVFLEARHGDDIGQLRPAFGQRAGFVDHQRIDARHALQRLGILDQDAGLGAATRRRHDRHGRCQTQRAGTGDDQHRNRRDDGKGEGRGRADEEPDREGQNSDGDNRRHEDACDPVGKTLDRRPRPLSGGHHLDDARQHRFVADLRRFDDEAAILIDRSRPSRGRPRSFRPGAARR